MKGLSVHQELALSKQSKIIENRDERLFMVLYCAYFHKIRNFTAFLIAIMSNRYRIKGFLPLFFIIFIDCRAIWATYWTTICNLMNSIHFLKKGEARHFCLRDRVLKRALLSMFHPRVLSPPKATHMSTECLTEVYKLFSRLFLFESFVSKKCRKLSISAY